jgi:hypothetical protein
MSNVHLDAKGEELAEIISKKREWKTKNKIKHRQRTQRRETTKSRTR